MTEENNMRFLGHIAKHTNEEKDLVDSLTNAFSSSILPLPLKLQHFSRHVRRQDIARLLAKYEIFKLGLTVNGSIVECGVFAGAGIMTWLHCSSILEPYNHTRKIIGFDTFSGFPSLDEKDYRHGYSEHLHEGALKVNDSILEEIKNLVGLHDKNRPLSHISKVELIAGDACETIPSFLESHPHLLISLLYLDFDIYKPSKIALENLYPRIVKGGIIAFDELNCPEFPGETLALLETLGLSQVKLCRFTFDPYISYFVKE